MLFFAPPTELPTLLCLNLTEKRFCQETLTKKSSVESRKIDQTLLCAVDACAIWFASAKARDTYNP
jgi:hypothetical protein